MNTVLLGLLALAVGTQAGRTTKNVPSCYRVTKPTWEACAPDGFKYRLFREAATYNQARAICKKARSDLTAVKTQATRNYINVMFSGLVLWTKVLGPTKVNKKLKRPFLCQKKCRYGCTKCAAKATMLNMAMAGGHVPTCAKDNSFAAKQCSTKHCWCVLKDGTKIEGSKRPSKLPLNCAKLRRKPPKKTKCQKKAGRPKGFKPKCDPNGDFSAMQCLNKNFCWCSLRDGTVIPMTLHNKKQPKPANYCHKHRDLSYKCGKKIGTYPHPFDKNRFMYCFMQNVFACHCPANLTYPQKANAVCTEKTKG